MRSLHIKEDDTGNGNPPPSRQEVPVEKDPIDVPATPAEPK